MEILELYETYMEQANNNHSSGSYTEEALDPEYGETIVWTPQEDGGYHGDYTEYMEFE